MSTLNFPASPSVNDEVIFGGRVYRFNGSAWVIIAAEESGIQGLQGIQGDTGIQGIQGAQGIQGTIGAQGLQGTTGIQGIAGPSTSFDTAIDITTTTTGTTFDLSQPVTKALVSLNGVWVSPNNFSFSGNDIVFAFSLP
jgi:hypothetical protein